MSKLRHIALSVPDPWADTPLAMGVYLTDGTVNIALLKYKTDELAGPLGKDFVGVHHIGFWVDDLQAAAGAVTAAGATHFAGEPSDDNTFCEVKYRDPVNGLIFDITAHGWVGATRDGAAGAALSNEALRADRSHLEKTA